MNSPLTYKQSGVNIDAGNDLVKKIAPTAKATTRPGVIGGVGGFGGLFDLKAAGFTDPILVSGTDGVGTKLKIAIETDILSTIGIDLVAMCANDILAQGALPLFFLDYLATENLDPERAAVIISGIAEGCKEAECALLGGETAEMPGFYPNKHFDLAGFCVGAVERDGLLPAQDIKSGDRLIGIASSGFHSNGYSLARRILEREGLGYDAACPWDSSLTVGEATLIPTKIYVKTLKPLLADRKIKAFIHITGGGMTENLPRVTPDHFGFHIDLNALPLPPCFEFMRQAGRLETEELLRVFNAGVGGAVIVRPEETDDVLTTLQNKGETAFLLGSVIEGRGVTYEGELQPR